MSTYVISREYTDAPGGRNIKDGPFSGEDFRESVLVRLLENSPIHEKILIDFDDSYGYPTSFLEESFGGLARKLGSSEVLGRFDFKSDDEPELINKVKEYIKNASRK